MTWSPQDDAKLKRHHDQMQSNPKTPLPRSWAFRRMRSWPGSLEGAVLWLRVRSAQKLASAAVVGASCTRAPGKVLYKKTRTHAGRGQHEAATSLIIAGEGDLSHPIEIANSDTQASPTKLYLVGRDSRHLRQQLLTALLGDPNDVAKGAGPG